MPTVYPKASPTEMMGLLVLLNDHHGSEDIALLADDLDLEIDEILPSLEYAEALQLVQVQDGRAEFTETGRELLAGSIRDRKTLLREQLRQTTLFRTLLGALESAPGRRLTDEEVNRLIEFTSASADDLVQNIINWGRYAELFRYDSDAHVLLPARARATPRTSNPPRPPPVAPRGTAAAGRPSETRAKGSPAEKVQSLAGIAP